MTAWEDPEWLRETERWIGERLGELGMRSGPLEQVHVRPWATVIRVDSPDGRLFFKANTPALAHEAAVVAVLSARRPDVVEPPLAVDAARGWLLLHDAGTSLREVVARERTVDRWLDVLRLYGGLQRACAPDVPALLAAGCPDLRLPFLPARLAELVDLLAVDPAEGLSPHEVGLLREAVPRVEAWCAELDALGIPATIEHDDLHDGQVFLRGDRVSIVDWGDACVTHPFLSLAVTLEGVIAWGPDDVEGSVDLAPFRDAYLGELVDAVGLDELRAAVPAALRVGWACRAVNGHAANGESPGSTATRLRMLLHGRPEPVSS